MESINTGCLVTGQALEGKLKIYELEITDTSKMLIISAEPADEESDPDIYVGINNP